MYDIDGGHLFQNTSKMSSNGIDYEFSVNTSNLHNAEYPYIIQCNNTKEGGFVSSSFQMTHNGKDLNPLNMIGIIFGIFVICVIMILLGLLLNNEHEILKFILYGSALLILMYVPTIMFEMFEVSTSTNIFTAYTWIIRIIFTYLFIYYFVYKPMIKWGWIQK